MFPTACALGDLGIRLAILSNGAAAVADELLTRAGLRDALASLSMLEAATLPSTTATGVRAMPGVSAASCGGVGEIEGDESPADEQDPLGRTCRFMKSVPSITFSWPGTSSGRGRAPVAIRKCAAS